MRSALISIFICLVLLTASLTLETGKMVMAPSQAAEAAKVSEHGLRRLFPGRFHAIAYGIVRVNITARADGSLVAQRSGKSDTGTWSIRSGRLCIKFAKWLKARTRCSTVTEHAGWYRTTDVAFKKVDGTAVAHP